MERYIDPERPRKYLYRSVNKSLADKYLLRHWWPIAIKLIPPNAPANLVSIVGNIGTWAGFFVLAGLVCGPMTVAGRSMPWLFGLVAFGLFFYQTLDALDGIQARRTGAAGPLGEFVDHWFDSFNVFILPFGIALAFPVIPAWMTILALVVCDLVDWITLRAVRDTGELYFPPVSTEEGQVLAQVFMLSVWAIGYNFWSNPIVLGLSPVLIGFSAMIVGLVVFAIGILPRAGGYGLLLAELATLAPMVAWTFLAIGAQVPGALLVGGMIVGLSGSRFTGELLRERLVGTEYRATLPDLVVMDLILLLSVAVPGLPAWVPLWVGLACLAWTVAALGGQFARTVARVKTVLGIGLLGPVKRPELDSVPSRR